MKRLLVLSRELLSREPGRFVEALARFAGSDIPRDLPFAVRRNESRGRFVAAKTRWLNQFACRNSLNGFSPLAPERRRTPLLRARDRLDRLVPRSLERSFVARQRTLVEKATDGYFAESNRATSELIGVDLSAYGYKTAENGPEACVA